VLYHSGPTFGQVLYSCQDAFVLMRLITQVTSLDTSSMLLKRFPWSGFFNLGNKSKSDGLMSGLYGGWGSTCHPYFFKISDTAPEAWGRTTCDLSHFHLPFQGSVLQNGPHSLPICTQCSLLKSGLQYRENRNDCILLLATHAQCAELLKWPTYIVLIIETIMGWLTWKLLLHWQVMLIFRRGFHKYVDLKRKENIQLPMPKYILNKNVYIKMQYQIL
jgi:hypothetical protein